MDAVKFGVVGLATGHPLMMMDILEKHGYALTYLAWDDSQQEEKERAATLKQKYPQVEFVADAAAMIAKGVQAVMCSSQAHRHLTDAQALIEARIPLFLEKPLAPGYDLAKQILDLVEQHDAPMMSCSVRLFSRNYNDVFTFIREGKIGTPLFVECFEPHGSHPGYWQDLKSASGGLVVNYGIHVCDPIIAALGTEIKSVHAYGGKQALPLADSEDTAIFTVQFASGAIAIGKACGGYYWGASHALPTVGHFIVHATEGALETYLDESDVKVYRGGNFGVSASYEPKGGFPATAAAFMEMVKTGKRPIALEHMHAVMKVLDAARKSIDSGQAVTF